MFEVREVIGRNDDGTTKYAPGIVNCDTDGEAIDYALKYGNRATKDVFRKDNARPPVCIARVHVDGGIDFR